MHEDCLMEDAEYCVTASGITSRVAKNAVLAARAEGIKVGMIRPLTVWPFPKKAFKDSTAKIKEYITVEMSMGQMIEDVRLSVEFARPVHLCNRAGGMIPSAEQVLAQIKEVAGGAR